MCVCSTHVYPEVVRVVVQEAHGTDHLGLPVLRLRHVPQPRAEHAQPGVHPNMEDPEPDREMLLLPHRNPTNTPQFSTVCIPLPSSSKFSIQVWCSTGLPLWPDHMIIFPQIQILQAGKRSNDQNLTADFAPEPHAEQARSPARPKDKRKWTNSTGSRNMTHTSKTHTALCKSHKHM